MTTDEFVKTFIIDESAPPATKSKDKLRAQYRGADDEHFAARFSKVFFYQVVNLTKVEKELPDAINDVRFWRSEEQKLLIVSCSCVARLVCKHIAEAYRVHKIALDAGFISD